MGCSVWDVLGSWGSWEDLLQGGKDSSSVRMKVGCLYDYDALTVYGVREQRFLRQCICINNHQLLMQTGRSTGWSPYACALNQVVVHVAAARARIEVNSASRGFNWCASSIEMKR